MYVDSNTSPVSNIENPSVVLLPGEVSLDLLGDVRLATSWQTNHDDDELGGDIAVCDLSIGGNSRLGHAGDIQGSRMGPHSGGLGTRVLPDGRDSRRGRRC